MPKTVADTMPDRKALAQQGAAVRARLNRDPSVYRVPVEGAEIYAGDDAHVKKPPCLLSGR